MWPSASEFHCGSTTTGGAAACPWRAGAPEVPAVDDVVLRVRRRAARSRSAGRRRRRARSAGRGWSRRSASRSADRARDHASSDVAGSPGRARSTGGKPVEAPLERPDDAVGRGSASCRSQSWKNRANTIANRTTHRVACPSRDPLAGSPGEPLAYGPTPATGPFDRRAVSISARVRRRAPTTCRPTGRPSAAPHGIVMAGCPVRLNSCVRRSVRLRTLSVLPSMSMRRRADRLRGDRQRRQEQRADLLDDLVDLAPEHGASLLRAHVVLAEHVAAHLEPDPHVVRVVVRRRASSVSAWYGGGLGEHGGQVDGRDLGRRAQLHVVDLRARAHAARPPPVERQAHAGLEPCSKYPRSRANFRPRRSPAHVVLVVGHGARDCPHSASKTIAASSTVRASGPT